MEEGDFVTFEFKESFGGEGDILYWNTSEALIQGLHSLGMQGPYAEISQSLEAARLDIDLKSENQFDARSTASKTRAKLQGDLN